MKNEITDVARVTPLTSEVTDVTRGNPMVFSYDLLPKEDQQEIDQWLTTFNVTDEVMRTTFGAKAQEQYRQFINKSLKEVAGTDAEKAAKDEIMGLIFQVNKVKLMPGFLERWFSNAEATVKKLKTRILSIEKIIGEIEKGVIKQQVQLKKSKDSVILHGQHAANALMNIEKCIIAGEIGLKREREVRLLGLQRDFDSSGSGQDKLALVECEKACNRFEVMISDFRTSQAALYNSILTAYHQKYAYENEIEGFRRIGRTLTNILADQCIALIRNEELSISAGKKNDLSKGLEHLIAENTKKLSATAIQIAENSSKPVLDTQVLVTSLQQLMQLGKDVSAIEVQSLNTIRVSKDEQDKIINEVRINFIEGK